jgi:hypothetical protein
VAGFDRPQRLARQVADLLGAVLAPQLAEDAGEVLQARGGLQIGPGPPSSACFSRRRPSLHGAQLDQGAAAVAQRDEETRIARREPLPHPVERRPQAPGRRREAWTRGSRKGGIGGRHERLPRPVDPRRGARAGAARHEQGGRSGGRGS